jgi:hypothetical protein
MGNVLANGSSNNKSNSHVPGHPAQAQGQLPQLQGQGGGYRSRKNKSRRVRKHKSRRTRRRY